MYRMFETSIKILKNYVKKCMKRMSSHTDEQFNGYSDIPINPDNKLSGFIWIS